MKNFNTINKSSNKKNHHIVISEENYNKLKSLGKLGDTFDKVLGEVLSQKNQQQQKMMMLESGQETPAAARTNNNHRVANNFQPSAISSSTITSETLITDEIISQ